MNDLVSERSALVLRSAVAGEGDWARITKSCLDQIGPIGSQSVGIVYMTERLATQAGSVLTLLKQLSGVAAWVGAVGRGVVGVGPNGPRAIADAPGMAILLLELPEVHYRLVRPGDRDPVLAGLDPAALDWLSINSSRSAILHGDARNAPAVAAAGRLHREAGMAVAGCLGSSRPPSPQVCGGLSEGGLTGVMFGELVRLATGIAQGCAPIGPWRTVTEVSHGRVVSLGRRPATQALRDDVGELLARDLRRTAGYVFCGLQPPGGPLAKLLVRPEAFCVQPMVPDDDGGPGLSVGAPVSVGDRIVFVRRDQAAALKALDSVLTGLSSNGGSGAVRGALFHACERRPEEVFGSWDLEIQRIADHLGPVPLAGLYGRGELVDDAVYTWSGALTIIRE